MSRVTAAPQAGSPRRAELLELAYAYVLRHGLGEMSLRPLAEAIGSSPRVLLYLFGSKHELVQALVERGRSEEVALLRSVRKGGGLAEAAELVWGWLADPAHRDLLRLWAEGYASSLVATDGPWAGYGARSVGYWLDVLATVHGGRGEAATAECTAVLAVLRGAALDLLATGDAERTTAAVRSHLAHVARSGRGMVH
jgi:AcrR family transcriptional regulator